MTDQLTEHEIDGLVERLRQRPEVRVAILEQRIAKAKAIAVEMEAEHDAVTSYWAEKLEEALEGK